MANSITAITILIISSITFYAGMHVGGNDELTEKLLNELKQTQLALEIAKNQHSEEIELLNSNYSASIDEIETKYKSDLSGLQNIVKTKKERIDSLSKELKSSTTNIEEILAERDKLQKTLNGVGLEKDELEKLLTRLAALDESLIVEKKEKLETQQERDGLMCLNVLVPEGV